MYDDDSWKDVRGHGGSISITVVHFSVMGSSNVFMLWSFTIIVFVVENKWCDKYNYNFHKATNHEDETKLFSRWLILLFSKIIFLMEHRDLMWQQK